MTQAKRPKKKPAGRAKSRGAKPMRGKRASVRAGFREVFELIDQGKRRGDLDAKRPRRVARPRATDTAPLARIIEGAKTEDQQLRALEAAARRDVALPAEALVVGEAVMVVAVTYSGHARAGLVVRCARGPRTFDVGLADVVFASGSDGARFVSLYRAWLGVGELAPGTQLASKVRTGDIVVGEVVELVVLACQANALRCRLLGSDRELTLRTAVRDEVPGEIATVAATKQWRHGGHAYLAGNVVAMRADVEALGLVPLAVHDQGEWDPAAAYWGENDESIAEWAEPIIARGKRPMFEMEQVVPGVALDDFDSDPILEAIELNAAGNRAGSRALLMRLLASDLRCLDAHAHLGYLDFYRRPDRALRHYSAGLNIGAFSLGRTFDGVLPWGLIDNRPFLRNLHGVGLCWWRLGQIREATAAFRKMLWLNPDDNQGARFNLADIEAGMAWRDEDADQ